MQCQGYADAIPHVWLTERPPASGSCFSSPAVELISSAATSAFDEVSEERNNVSDSSLTISPMLVVHGP